MTALRPAIVFGLAALTFASGASAQVAPAIPIAQSPLFISAQLPPLNMLVVGKDHKNYYEAYNDASDLNGDGELDVGYKPAEITYFGYFNSFACYLWDAGENRFEPVAAAPNKTCGGAGQWSGDFLNYLTTSRMDALRRVLYGGWRHQDTPTDTTLQGAFFPQDAHSWGKEYQSIARDGFDIRQYAPLGLPGPDGYHLFAVTTVRGNAQAYPNYEAPILRVMQNTTSRIWNWLSIEGPVAGNRCFNASNNRVDCSTTGAPSTVRPDWAIVPQSALSNVRISTWRWDGSGRPVRRNNGAETTEFFDRFAIPARLCGTGAIASGIIDTSGRDNNPFAGNNACTHDNYLSEITATLTAPRDGEYEISLDGSDTVEVAINGNVVAHRYGSNGPHARTTAAWNNHRATITLTAGTHTVRFRHVEDTNNDSWALAWRPPPVTGPWSRQDYAVRVQVCPQGSPELRDIYCRPYGSPTNPVFKPTGILHDYGQSERMKFGLITGSQLNNLEGGILRRNIRNFRDEIDMSTGQFRADVRGIVDNLDRLRMVGGGYNSGVADNFAGDTNWNWANGLGNCPSIGNRPINNGECRMWGNPVGEMLFESMRYFAGAGAPTPRFTAATTTQGVTEEGPTRMGLGTEPWLDPYGTGASGLGYLSCARPYQTIISDINPSYDGDLPGSPFNNTGDTLPTPISTFNVATQGNVIWNHEFGGATRNVFIGQSGTVVDNAPTAKAVSSLGNIRGLAPEEPSKLGTYSTASVARFARVTDVSAAEGVQNVSTFAVALASPLPRIEFPVRGRTVTLIPYAMTVSGTFGEDPNRKPVNTIVDFYVERIVNLPGAPTDTTVNEGRPYAVFRINYEDVEQGNDHDMDAIVRYEVVANDNGTVTVTLDSEYAAGSANQNIGYVMSGTTADGVYLEVRDRDGPGTPFRLNTPPGATAGQCAVAGALGSAPCNQALPLNTSRTFTPADRPSALTLPDPLWFAAKYGGFRENATGGNNLPDGAEWDSDTDRVPDNYFLVTNPLELREQLSEAFDAILSAPAESGTIANTGSRIGVGSAEFVPEYRVTNARDWTGDVNSYEINRDGTRGTLRWSAAAQLAGTDPTGRRIITRSDDAARVPVPFRHDQFGATDALQFAALGLSTADAETRFGAGVRPADVFAYLRGDRSRELSQPNGIFRTRTALIGSIIHSEPEVSLKTDVFRWISVPDLRDDYQTFLTAKRANASRPNMLYVGSNNGFLHGFNTATGQEVFAYVPASSRREMGQIADKTFTHRYFVDGDITVVDAPLSGGWRTVLLGSTGRGGRSVFALDVTNPQNFNESMALWELEGGPISGGFDADMGHVIGRPQVMYGEDNNWYAVFGNGVNSENSNPVLMIVNLSTGAVVRKLTANDGGNLTNGLVNVSMVDANGNGRIDAAYGGDLQGNLWKFDLSATSASAWGVAFGGRPMFIAQDENDVRQPITGGIDIARGAGGLMVFFGTGRYLSLTDTVAPTNAQTQTIYGVRDNGAQFNGTRDDLVEQTISSTVTAARVTRTTSNNAVDFRTQRGWYLDLVVGSGPGRGERFTGDPEVRGGVVFFPTFETSGDACRPGAQNWMYGLDAITGSSALGGTQSLTGTTVCGVSCGAVQTTAGAPIRSAIFTQQAAVCRPGIDPGCSAQVPQPPTGTGGGPPPPPPPGAQTRCGEVERHTGAVFERACGRQSWRQIR